MIPECLDTSIPVMGYLLLSMIIPLGTKYIRKINIITTIRKMEKPNANKYTFFMGSY
jgi:hypothetical protein